MYEIYFYRDNNGKEPVKEYIAGLVAKKGLTTRFYEADTKNPTEGNRTGKTEFNRLSREETK